MIRSQSYCFSGNVTLYFFFLISFVLHTLASSMLPYCHHDQRDALLEFRHEISENDGSKSSPNDTALISSWNKTSDCCSWEGVKCDSKSGKVTSLNLTSIPLNNSLKPNSSLFKLHHLTKLVLYNCSLYGEIPSSLGNLSHLTLLDLGYNYLGGQVPASIRNLSHLTLLNLEDNHLVGEVLPSITNLTQLGYLSLSNNQFSGNMPVSFAMLSKLALFDISTNQFTGENFALVLPNLTSLSFLNLKHNHFKSKLPPDMSRFHNLEYFNVGRNSFSGPFPNSLFTISSLVFVYLDGNQFKGPIEFENTSSSSQLQTLYLSQNQFYGHIPKSISKFSNLESLGLGGNNFTGPIPISMSKLVSLSVLDLSYNNFIGPIPRSVSNLVNLDNLDLSYNKLEGEVPGCVLGLRVAMLSHNSFSTFEKTLEVSNVNHILALDLSSNSFRGYFPHWICNLRSLHLLDLSNNSFSGSIPQCIRNTIVGLRQLHLGNNNFSGVLLPDIFNNATSLLVLDVSGNQLEGELPKSLVNCKDMQLLNVQGNRIKDKFPSWLSSLPSLHVLILGSNEFYGPLYHPHVSIGFQSLRVIDVSNNDFSGTLPPFYFSSWREMATFTEVVGHMYMADFTYAEYILTSMKMVNKGVDTIFEQVRRDFRAIDFSGNKFGGKIPDSIGLLKELRLLNLSGNIFTSNIPQALANLTNLEALDISRNQLTGAIPQDLASLSFLSVMNFSHNNLEGPVPQGTQFQRQNCSSFIDNPKLYGLEEICRHSRPTPQESEDLSEPEEQVISWIAAAIAYGPGVFCGLVIGHIFVSRRREWFMAKFGRNK